MKWSVLPTKKDKKGVFIFRWNCHRRAVWPDWAIYCTLDNFSKPVATIILPNLSTFLGNSCKSVKIFHSSSEIRFGQYLSTFGNFLLVTLCDKESSREVDLDFEKLTFRKCDNVAAKTRHRTNKRTNKRRPEKVDQPEGGSHRGRG